jgi:hypothetical protein
VFFGKALSSSLASVSASVSMVQLLRRRLPHMKEAIAGEGTCVTVLPHFMREDQGTQRLQPQLVREALSEGVQHSL